jgi:hypothetical protein
MKARTSGEKADAIANCKNRSKNNKSESSPATVNGAQSVAPGSADDELIRRGMEATKKPAKLC